jgi:hypothetical protein
MLYRLSYGLAPWKREGNIGLTYRQVNKNKAILLTFLQRRFYDAAATLFSAFGFNGETFRQLCRHAP